jgi:hypothetical protein
MAGKSFSEFFSIKPNKEQLETLTWIGKCTLVIIVLWYIPSVGTILKPFKLLTVALHEMGHALLTVLTGGRVLGLTINENEGGLTRFVGGSPFFSFPAGYLGALFWGAFLLYSSFSHQASKIAAVAMSGALVFALLYAQNSLTVTIVYV